MTQKDLERLQDAQLDRENDKAKQQIKEAYERGHADGYSKGHTDGQKFAARGSLGCLFDDGQE